MLERSSALDRRDGAHPARRRTRLASMKSSPLGEKNRIWSRSMTHDLGDYLDAATNAARRAADVLESWRQRFAVREKGRFDFVTDADVASQKAIHEYLLGRYPGHEFLGEEDASKHRRPTPDAPPTWIVDPIDGTTNYVHDCPFYCVSIGLQIAGELVVGVVFDPSRNELFAGATGSGATVNGRPLRTS